MSHILQITDMRAVYKFAFLFVILTAVMAKSVNMNKANSKEIAHQKRAARETPKRVTDVVNLAFCESSLDLEDNMGKDRVEDVHTYAELKYDPHASLPDSFTVCSTILRPNCPNFMWPTFFTILDNERDQFLAASFKPGVITSLLKIYYLQGTSEPVNGKIPPLFPNQWTRSCMAINTISGLIHWVVEGTLVMTTISEEVKNSKNRPKNLSNKLVLGARAYAGIWYAPSQEVTNLNIFSSALSIENMKSMTEGPSCLEEGDYLAWVDMEWIFHGKTRKETVDKKEPCKGEPHVNLYYTKFSGMKACMYHCENLGTRVPSVTDRQNWVTIQHSLKMDLYDKGQNTLELWLPVEDTQAEGEWRDFYTDSLMQNYTQPWAGSGPDGGTGENCAFILDENTWSDYGCDSTSFACMCTHDPSIHLELKGLCPNSAIDLYYKPISDLTDARKLKLQGLKQTLVRYDAEEGMWILDARDSNVTGISRASHASFTLGKHNWTIQGDKACYDEGPRVTELKISGCKKGNFTCNDGQCVRMDQRCNQLPDCRDKSDERNCNILVLEDGYNMEVPPVNSSDPVDVLVSMDLLKLVDINEEDYSIEIQFEITLAWKEKRAIYHNLKKRDSLNALSQNDIKMLWLPEVVYENTDQKETTRLGEFGNGEWKTKMIVKKEVEHGTMSGPESVDETEIFSGFENSLVMNQTYTHTFQCNYQLSRYPFDTQVNVHIIF